MKSIQINIPDNYLFALKEFISTIPHSSIVENESFILNAEQIDILEKRSKMDDDKYLTIDEVNARLKAKYV
jgi:hypothetical protein